MRKILRPSTIWRKVEGKPYIYPEIPSLPSLPSLRTLQSIPFQHTARLDDFGPILYFTESTQVSKRYGCLFNCFATRAIHIEFTPDLSTQHFSFAVQKFVNRRGSPATFYSDNAAQIKAFQEIHSNSWEYVSPLAPWQGGLYSNEWLVL